MILISYAQNHEDVMLWRALKHVELGFYIDVGAAWPDEHSVTKSFYERGWCGINIEPNPKFYRQLEEWRPLDKNLRIAVGDHEGVLTMNFLGNSGLSTLDDVIAEQHQKDGWSLDRQEVQVTTLNDIWQQHVPTSQEVQFLKIDVEGFEAAVVRGNDWSKNRPWIVVVEAALPMTQVESHEAWEPILLQADYWFAYADGLNRFYVAKEHSELMPAFKYPPNVFDEFKLTGQQEAEARATQAEARATQAEARATQAEARASQHAEEVFALRNSLSWKITAPLRTAPVRWVAGFVIHPSIQFRQLANSIIEWCLNTFERSLFRLFRLVMRYPRVNIWLNYQLIRHFPRLHRHLRTIVQRKAVFQPSEQTTYSLGMHTEDLATLTPRARKIYCDLKAALTRQLEKET